MGILDLFSHKENLEEELKGLIKAQELLDDRYNKRQVSPEFYKQKSLEFMLRKEKIEKKLSKENN